MASIKLLSVLVPTIPTRLTDHFPRIIQELERQAVGKSVEILGFYDNCKRSVGEKRNALLQWAQGTFIAFVDDDDRIAPDYLNVVLGAVRDHLDADVICFKSECRIDDGPPKLCKYSLSYKSYSDTPTLWTGPPAHTMVWKAKVAKQSVFPEKNFSEDSDWVRGAVQVAKKEHQIDRVLYFYDFRSGTTATRAGGRGMPAGAKLGDDSQLDQAAPWSKPVKLL
jgi:glycosyltransferase involved in cell wall biosynthesis